MDPNTNDYFQRYKRIDNFMTMGSTLQQEKWGTATQKSEISASRAQSEMQTRRMSKEKVPTNYQLYQTINTRNHGSNTASDIQTVKNPLAVQTLSP